MGGTHFAAEGQSAYNNARLLSIPTIPIPWCAASTISTSVAMAVPRGVAPAAGTPAVGSAQYVHADQHAIVLPGGNLIYAANDGGVAVSEDLGETWSMRVRRLVNTMFYDIDVAPGNGKIFGGGAPGQRAAWWPASLPRRGTS